MVGNGQLNSRRVRALVLTGFGINCDRETAQAFERAGADAVRMHLNDLLAAPDQLDEFQIFAVPGGFSFGDDVASGRILANRLRYRLGEALVEFVDAGNLVIGICNGFQVIVKMGLLPGNGQSLTQTATLTHNDSGRFENRWVRMNSEANSICVWTEGIDQIEMPVRHGEGKFVADPGLISALESSGQIVLRYASTDGRRAMGAYPANPNGSQDDVAGICDATGRVFGLMPHPEAFVDFTNHPRWTRGDAAGEGAGMRVFRNGVAHAARLAAKSTAAR